MDLLIGVNTFFFDIYGKDLRNCKRIGARCIERRWVRCPFKKYFDYTFLYVKILSSQCDERLSNLLNSAAKVCTSVHVTVC